MKKRSKEIKRNLKLKWVYNEIDSVGLEELNELNNEYLNDSFWLEDKCKEVW